MSRAVAIGIGCRKNCSAGAVEALVHRALQQADGAAPIGLFTLIEKRGETGLHEAARNIGLALLFLTREQLSKRSSDALTRSARVEALFGAPSIAETAALAGAGPGSVLIVTRLSGAGVTCAVAEAKENSR